jgi:hypothetical protein
VVVALNAVQEVAAQSTHLSIATHEQDVPYHGFTFFAALTLRGVPGRNAGRVLTVFRRDAQALR